ncbi:hypothetical protein [Thomasclavelia cocleata]|uniref:hypothetical protein n=1 Tax=Thomasclavelia cocleata TaxID=69824 RepID=UPI0024328C13|nr:hypothetical protein [Thomasclavelia cocleata]
MGSEDFKEKKHFLMRYRKNIAKINRLKTLIYILDEEIKSVKSVKYDSSSRGGEPSENKVNKKIDYEIRLSNIKKITDQYKREIIECIDNLEDIRFIDVLEKYFIDCYDMEEISIELNYSLRYTRYLYSQAIEHITLNVH